MSIEPGKSEHYRERAKELRSIAAKFQTDEARRLLSRIADHYEALARKLDEQAADRLAREAQLPAKNPAKPRPSENGG